LGGRFELLDAVPRCAHNRTVVRISNNRSKNRRAGRRAEARRAEILTAASRVFRTMGFAAAGMRDIAVAADLSPANLYHYFSGKHEILCACQNLTLDRLQAAADAAARARGPIAGRLRALATDHVLCVIDQIQGSAVHFELDALPGRLRAAVVARRDRYERAVRALVAAGIRRAELAPADPAVATRAFLGALNWTVQWFRPDGALPGAVIASMLADYAVGGLENRRAENPDRAHPQRRAARRRVRAVQDAARGAA
jgi:AcrR family transcriptional regulator